jgi:hypothetical protein
MTMPCRAACARAGRRAGVVLIAAAIVTAVQISARAQQALRIDRLSWLQGCWEMRTPQGTVEEQWMSPRGGAMVGVGRTVRNDRLVEYEMVIVREDGGGLAYEAHPSGQPSAVFRSREITGAMAAFENQQHDFPQRIGYRQDGPDVLAAWIEGSSQGQPRRIDFTYRRVPCPGTK